MVLNEFIPPILIKLVKGKRGFEASKEYENYAMAIKACTADAYQNAELCNMISDKTAIHLKNLKNKPYSLNSTNVFLLSAINQYINTFSKENLKILDFGGACGAHYFETRRFISQDFSLEWFVVETNQMVKAAIDKGLSRDELKFVNSIEDINTEIDFIHSSGALQYVPDPYELLNRLIKVRANWVFFNRMMFNENDRDFVTVQKSFLSLNGPGKLPAGYRDKIISYPHTTMSFRKFNSTMLAHDYELEWLFDESSGSYRIKDEKIVGKGLLYIRK